MDAKGAAAIGRTPDFTESIPHQGDCRIGVVQGDDLCGHRRPHARGVAPGHIPIRRHPDRALGIDPDGGDIGARQPFSRSQSRPLPPLMGPESLVSSHPEHAALHGKGPYASPLKRVDRHQLRACPHVKAVFGAHPETAVSGKKCGYTGGRLGSLTPGRAVPIQQLA